MQLNSSQLLPFGCVWLRTPSARGPLSDFPFSRGRAFYSEMVLPMPIADMLIELGMPSHNASARLRWFANWLPNAEKRILSERGLARINRCRVTAEPHELLAAVTSLQKPVWYETATAHRGMIRGYGVVPIDNGVNGVDIGCACFSHELNGMVEPLGPARVTTTAMLRPDHLGDRAWRELHAAAGIVLRALLVKQRR